MTSPLLWDCGGYTIRWQRGAVTRLTPRMSVRLIWEPSRLLAKGPPATRNAISVITPALLGLGSMVLLPNAPIACHGGCADTVGMRSASLRLFSRLPHSP